MYARVVQWTTFVLAYSISSSLGVPTVGVIRSWLTSTRPLEHSLQGYSLMVKVGLYGYLISVFIPSPINCKVLCILTVNFVGQFCIRSYAALFNEIIWKLGSLVIISENKTLASTEGSSSICRNFKRRYDKYNYFTGKYEEKGFRLMITSTRQVEILYLAYYRHLTFFYLANFCVWLQHYVFY